MSKDNVREKFNAFVATLDLEELGRKDFTIMKLLLMGYQASHAESAARIAELEKDRDEWKDATIYANARFKIAEDRVAELERQNDDHVAELEQDAARYRWLRIADNSQIDLINRSYGDELDEAIDQAITNTGDKA